MDRYDTSKQNPYGFISASASSAMLAQPTTAERISELSKTVAMHAAALQGAREAFDAAGKHLQEAQSAYGAASSELSKLMIEHGEGTPEGVPYPR